MELVHQLEQQPGEESPLAKARLQRQLTVEETARRAGLTPEEIRWLEEGRVYRFATPDDALLAALVYATALGVDAAEARELAGLPPQPSLIARHPRARYAVLGAVAVAVAVALAVVFIPHDGGSKTAASQAANLPPPWKIPVTVLNGSGDMEYTRRVADRVLSLAYRVKKVGRADNFNYQASAVFFPPRCEGIAARLADELGVDSRPLPGGTGRCQLFVIVGPPRGPDS